LKIATLAIVMEKGLGYLPHGALQASFYAIFIGVVFELLLSIRRKNAQGEEKALFPWIPIPAAFGFALILPPSLTIATSLGCVVAAVWRKFSDRKDGSFDLYAAPMASGLIAGEAMVGSILMPALAMLLEWLR
jgi:uncharacterized oligopeptide transporter (OPT) family protein